MNVKTESAIKRDLLLFPAVIWITIYAFLGRTNFSFNWNGIYGLPLKIESVCWIIVIFYAVYNILIEEEMTRKTLFICLVLLGIIAPNNLFILWVALAGRSMKTWLSIGVGIYISMFGLTMIAACAGIIGMGTHGAWEGNFLGMQTEGQFGFVLLFLLLQVAILKQGQFRYYEYVAICIIIFLNARIFVKRNPNICMVIFVIMLIGHQIYLQLGEGKAEQKLVSTLQKYFFDYSFILAFGIFTVCVFFRNFFQLLQPRFKWLRTLILRFDDTAEMWKTFPITLFGRNIRTYNGKNATVLLLDPQYSSTLILDGLVVFVVMMLISTYFMVKARKQGYGTMYIALMVMALFSISDPVAWGLSLNFLIALPFSNWDIKDS